MSLQLLNIRKNCSPIGCSALSFRTIVNCHPESTLFHCGHPSAHYLSFRTTMAELLLYKNKTVNFINDLQLLWLHFSSLYSFILPIFILRTYTGWYLWYFVTLLLAMCDEFLNSQQIPPGQAKPSQATTNGSGIRSIYWPELGGRVERREIGNGKTTQKMAHTWRSKAQAEWEEGCAVTVVECVCRRRILFLAKLIYICIFIRFLYSLYLQLFKYLKDFVFESIGGFMPAYKWCAISRA